MKKSPEISVIMPVYNESIHDLKESIDAILNQTYHNFEYIIIDDNPDNMTIKNYIKQRANNDDRVRLVFNKHNLKLTKTENKGISLAQGKYIARIDADDIAYKDRLQSQLDFCIKYHLDISSTNISLINDADEVTRRSTFNTHDIVDQSKVKSIMKYGNIAVGPTFFFKKSIVNKLNQYRDFNGEDYDLVARALINGYGYGFQAKPLIYKRLRRNSMTFHGTLSQYMAERTISKYLRKFRYTKIMPVSFLNDSIKSVSSVQQRHFRDYASARYTYNDKKNIFNLLKIFFTIIKSKIVFQRCLWSLMNKYEVRYK